MIYNLNGVLVEQGEGNETTPLGINLNSGAYVIQVNYDQTTFWKKIIKL